MSYVVLFSHSSTFLPLSFLLYFTCLYFFIPACILSVLSLFALFLIFWTDLLNFSPFISFLCSFDNKPHFFSESLHYFLLLPFLLIPCTFSPTCIFYFFFLFLLFHCKADGIGKFCGGIYMGVFHVGGGINFK